MLLFALAMTTTKKITVLGATGETGIQVVKQALAAKYEVTAIVRNPDKLKGIQKNRLKVNSNFLKPKFLNTVTLDLTVSRCSLVGRLC